MIKNFIDERTYVNTIGPGSISRTFSVTRKAKSRSASHTRSLRPRPGSRLSFEKSISTRKTSPLGTNKTD